MITCILFGLIGWSSHYVYPTIFSDEGEMKNL